MSHVEISRVPLEPREDLDFTDFYCRAAQTKRPETNCWSTPRASRWRLETLMKARQREGQCS